MEFYSHPDKKLIIHLKEVRDMAIATLPKELEKLGDITAFCHDFGKYTAYFQNYLFSRTKAKTIESNHGFISAVFGAYCGFNEFGEKSKYPYIIYSSILHHHGSLKNPEEDLPLNFNKFQGDREKISLIEKINTCYTQLEDMRNNLSTIKEDYKDTVVEKHLEEFILNPPVEATLLKLKKHDFFIGKLNKSTEEYFIHQMLYSSIISSDKLSASNTKLAEMKFTDFQELNTHKEEKLRAYGITNLNNIRSEIFNNIQKELQSISNNISENKLFSITSPTGTGKTYSGFFAALKLKDLLKDREETKDIKIIYSLPFTSIINQNYIAIEELLSMKDDYEKNKNAYLIKHHNLSNVDYEVEEYNYNKLEAELLIENWNSGIVVTTFVQLLQTLVGTKNRMLKKFNSIRNSIIILDEIQAIDIKLYKLVDYILRESTEKLNCKIIMMTATKPLILQDAKELLKYNEKYFRQFNRTTLYPILSKTTVEEFAYNFKKSKEDKSYLIICNTINQSIEIFNNLKEEYDEVYYLSTNLLPLDRKEIIDKIKDLLLQGEKVILVSTQVVEAGVDLDFDVVIRDIAPLDSIIQAAGRCNRNGNKEKGSVYIYNMVKDNGQPYGDLIYGKTLLEITRELLSSNSSIEEREYFNFIEKYFKEVNSFINQEASVEFIKSLQKLRFSHEPKEKYSLNKFSLINNNPDYFDVFFIKDEKAQKVFNTLMKMIGEKDFYKKKEIYLSIKSDVRNYTLSLPIKYKTKINIEAVIPNVSQELFTEIYDSKTGFIREDKEEFLIF